MKITLDLPDELFREVKLRAVVQRRTVKAIVADFLRQGLGLPTPAMPASLPPDSMVEIGTGGLPVIRCKAGAPATRMRVKKLLQLEQAGLAEEDLRRAGIPS